MMSFILKSPQNALRVTRQLTKQRGLYYFASQAQTENKTNVSADNLGVKDKATKDLDFQEQALKFEREWKKLYDENVEKQTKALNEELTEHQRKRVDLIIQATLELNSFELRYFASQIRTRIQRTSGLDPMKLNLDWPSLKQLEEGTWPPANPNWFAQQEAMAKLWPMGMAGFGGAFGGMFGAPGGAPVGGAVGGAPAGGAPAGEAPKEEKKEEKKAEKLNFDIELTVVDAAQKIKIIKEVRQLLNLGLKEAKEMVEKAPVVLKKEVKKEEAEKIKEILVGCGCTITLL